MVQSQALPLHGGKRGEEEKDIQMDRARWGRLSGDGTSWTLLAASVLAEQRPGRGRAGVVKWLACADASREGTRPARCAGVGSDALV